MGINIAYSSNASCCLSWILFCFNCICCVWRGFVWSLHRLGMGFLLCQQPWECLLRQNEQSNMYPWKLVIIPWLLLCSLTIPEYYFCKFLIKLQISGIGFISMRPFGWSIDQPLLVIIATICGEQRVDFMRKTVLLLLLCQILDLACFGHVNFMYFVITNINSMCFDRS
jgi:hypothetical protein